MTRNVTLPSDVIDQITIIGLKDHFDLTTEWLIEARQNYERTGEDFYLTDVDTLERDLEAMQVVLKMFLTEGEYKAWEMGGMRAKDKFD